MVKVGPPSGITPPPDEPVRPEGVPGSFAEQLGRIPLTWDEYGAIDDLYRLIAKSVRVGPIDAADFIRRKNAVFAACKNNEPLLKELHTILDPYPKPGKGDVDKGELRDLFDALQGLFLNADPR